MIDIKYDLEIIDIKRELVKKKLFEKSKHIKIVDFKEIDNNDLYLLYILYDEIFLQSWFKSNFKGNITFKLSKQLSRSAGNTKTKKNIDELKEDDIEFEIKISANHLLNFDKVDRSKYVGGIEAKSKLDSLMLVFEHELCHVIEFLLYKRSDCSKQDFKDLIFNLFGQHETTHKLVSAKEVDYQKYKLLVGDNVSFNYEGIEIYGIINKINKRAIVMSPSKCGKYVDKKGQHYTKYYVPLNCLAKC